MEKIILTDIDGVLLNWFEGFEAFVSEQHPLLLGKGSCAPYASQKRLYQWLGLPSFEEGKKIVTTFYGSKQDYQLRAYPDALEYLPRLHQEGWTLIAVTHSVNPEISHDVKLHCLRQNFGDIFETIHSLNLDESKAFYLKEYAPTFWIEDNLKNAVAGAEYGHHPFLIFRDEWGAMSDEIADAPKITIPVKNSSQSRKIKLTSNWSNIYHHIQSENILKSSQILASAT